MTLKAIVIGASSGIGKSLAKVLSAKGFEVGLMARRKERLLELQQNLPNPSFVKVVDITQVDEARRILLDLIQEMHGVDLIIINSGIAFFNEDLNWQKEKDTIETNVLGFCAMATLAMSYFLEQGKGHLVTISSIQSLRGSDNSPAYGASKAFVSNYVQGLQKKVFKSKKPIYVTDILPGYVDTEIRRSSHRFWVASSDAAAQQIFEAIEKKKVRAYITHRWILIAWLMRIAPDWLYNRIN